MWKAEICAAAALLGLFLLLWRIWRCAHAWELVDKTEFKPPIEDMRGGTNYSNSDLKWMHCRKVALAIRCSKCGAAKILTAKNPD